MSPQVSVAGPLDRETTPTWEMQVEAYDMGTSRMTSEARLRVTLTDVNDNAPVFEFPSPSNRSLMVPHTLSPRTAFGHVRATDADLGPAARLVYARDGGNGSTYFDVSRAGEVTMHSTLFGLKHCIKISN